MTASTWHPAFAHCLARVARQLREVLGAPIDVVDVGAGEGELLGAIGEALRRDGDAGRGFRLAGVERSATRRARARERVPSAAWVSALEEIPVALSGLVVAYELFDALPVRALLFEGGKLLERVVTLGADGGFEWAVSPCADGDAMLESLVGRGVRLREGQALEIRPAAAGLARDLAARLDRGLLLVFDYGARSRSLYGFARSGGTLEAFHAHRVSRDVLSDPGSRDITAWVDFSELELACSDSGLVVSGLVSQARFLSAAGIGEEIAAAEGLPSETDRLVERHALGELVAPGGMGESIRVLVASRDTDLAGRLVQWPDRGIVPSNH